MHLGADTEAQIITAPQKRRFKKKNSLTSKVMMCQNYAIINPGAGGKGGEKVKAKLLISGQNLKNAFCKTDSL